MAHYKYLIVGAGMTGDAAVRGIRKSDKDGSLGVIGIEADPPYNRPPLSKGLWKGKPIDKIWRGTQDRAMPADHRPSCRQGLFRQSAMRGVAGWDCYWHGTRGRSQSPEGQ
jgi:hypothetical protein